MSICLSFLGLCGWAEKLILVLVLLFLSWSTDLGLKWLFSVSKWTTPQMLCLHFMELHGCQESRCGGLKSFSLTLVLLFTLRCTDLRWKWLLWVTKRTWLSFCLSFSVSWNCVPGRIQIEFAERHLPLSLCLQFHQRSGIKIALYESNGGSRCWTVFLPFPFLVLYGWERPSCVAQWPLLLSPCFFFSRTALTWDKKKDPISYKEDHTANQAVCFSFLGLCSRSGWKITGFVLVMSLGTHWPEMKVALLFHKNDHAFCLPVFLCFLGACYLTEFSFFIGRTPPCLVNSPFLTAYWLG